LEILVGQFGQLSSKELLNEVLVDPHFVVVQPHRHVRQPLALGGRLACDEGGGELSPVSRLATADEGLVGACDPCLPSQGAVADCCAG
jgi:hypothetical protein